MPHIQINLEYDVDLADYPGATTVAGAYAQDLESVRIGDMALEELVGQYDAVISTWVVLD